MYGGEYVFERLAGNGLIPRRCSLAGKVGVSPGGSLKSDALCHGDEMAFFSRFVKASHVDSEVLLFSGSVITRLYREPFNS